MTVLRMLEARPLTDEEQNIRVRHERTYPAEVCDFCRVEPPIRAWQLYPCAIDVPGAVVILGRRMFACAGCFPVAATARDLYDLTGVAAFLPDDDPDVRQAMWTAFLNRRVPYGQRVKATTDA